MVKSIIDDYIDYHNKYKNKYEKMIVLIEVGSFYEAYSTDTEGPNLYEISTLLEIVYTRKDKSINKIDRKNPYMLGFNKISSIKFISQLLNNGYTVITVNQIYKGTNSSGKKEFSRDDIIIYSAGTCIDYVSKPDSNFISCIYIEEEIQKNGKYILCAGLTAIDVSTGKSYYYECYSQNGDEKKALDETIRFIQSINPIEIIIVHNEKVNGITKKNLLVYLGLDEHSIHYIGGMDFNKKYQKISYQNEFFKNVYKECGSINPIEYINFEFVPYVRISHIILLDFIYDHNKNILNNLSIPEIYFDNKKMILGNNALVQLNVFESDINQTNAFDVRYRSLFDVINKTSTSMGRRFLKEQLTCPLVCNEEIEKLNYIYDCNNELIENKLYNKVEEILKDISDIERLYRKIVLKIIYPIHFYDFTTSYKKIKSLVTLIKTTKYCKEFLPEEKYINELEEFLKNISITFNNDELCKYTLNDITTNIFMPGVCVDIDQLIMNINTDNNFITILSKKISDILKIKKDKQLIMIKRNDREGHYLSTTKIRGELLKKEINIMNNKKIDINGYIINLDNIIYKNNLNTTKIIFPELIVTSNELKDLELQIDSLTRLNYLKKMDEYIIKYSSMFTKFIDFVSKIDYIKSNAKTAVLYNYCRPQPVLHNEGSFITCKKIRHPIIERIIDTPYIPHDIDIGNKIKGILLHGLNSSGKSALMKAIGLNIIMAQAGMYVAAESYTFCPFKSLMTRISGYDNIFRGYSSFALEMLELKTILKRGDKYSMIIGDEICRSTEITSANGIVAGSIIKLSENKCNFIFATHLHQIAKMERIKNIPTVKSYHIDVTYDNNLDELIYDRILKEGQGNEIYGITVAKYIIKDNEFIKLVLDIKNEIEEDYGSLISGKTSKYNSKIYIHECQLCHKRDLLGCVSQLHTHHIKFQKDCINGFSKEEKHLKKNDQANLVVLCVDCHHKLHENEINIESKVMTSSGVKLKIK